MPMPIKILFFISSFTMFLSANTFDMNMTTVSEVEEVLGDTSKINEDVTNEISNEENMDTGKKRVSAFFKKKGKKVITFIHGKAFKEGTRLSKHKLLKKVTDQSVVMMVYSRGKMIYKVFNGEDVYKDIAKILITKLSSGVALFTPPPVSFVIKFGTEELLIFAIDKYEELDKRNYVDIEDMLWDVPKEIKNKITVLNIEETKKETVFDFTEIDRETILDDENEGESIFDENQDKEKSILDY